MATDSIAVFPGAWRAAAGQRVGWPKALAAPHPAFGHPLPAARGEGHSPRVSFSPQRGEKVPKADEGWGATVPPNLDLLLVRSAETIALDNLRHLAPWFTPLGGEIPRGLLAISEEGLLRVRAVHRLREMGPDAMKTILGETPVSGERATAGDCAALHFAIEELIASLDAPAAAPPARPPADQPAGPPARLGGLRSPDTLRIVPDMTKKWASAIGVLVERSPLTQLVYADLFRVASGSAAFAPLFRNHGTASMDLWISHLARSLLAARAGVAGLSTLLNASLFFHIRFLDMLVRRIAADCGEAMLQAKERKAEPRDYFFMGEDSVCFRRFEELTKPFPRHEVWRALDPPSFDPAAVAGETGASRDEVRLLLQRFLERPIPLPLPGRWGHPPQRIWSRWYVLIANRIAGPERAAS